MATFRKRPIEIEAYQFDNRISNQPPFWLKQAIDAGTVVFHARPDFHLTIQTLEGEMRVSEDDWVIKGIAGELYPCKPEIFAATYEPIAQSTTLNEAT